MTQARKTHILILALTAAGLFAAAPAGAQAANGGQQVQVRYADLDLGHAAGQKVLSQRVERAATKACGLAPDSRALTEWTAFQKCRLAAVDSARPQMERARLDATARYASR